LSRVPLLSDTRLLVVEPRDEDVVLRPPAPRDILSDVGQAARDALAFPLAGPPLEDVVVRGGTATIVVEHPSLPIPGVPLGPRHIATAAVADELERLGVEQTTILVAGGLGRRMTPRDIGLLVPPDFRRRFRGRLIVHDVEADDLVEMGSAGGVPLRVNPALVETDLVVCVTAAETVLDGGPASLLKAGGGEALRVAGARSLLETTGSRGWQLAVELERLLAARVPVLGLSLLLNLPQPSGFVAGYPHDQAAVERMLRSRVRRVFQVAPGFARRRLLDRLPRELTAAAAYAGPPSVAHTEALLRGTVFKGFELPEPLDAIVVGVPPATPWVPREQANPVTAAYLALGLALRLWRTSSAVADGGTAILLHPLPRRFPSPSQEPYRTVFFVPRTARDPEALREAEAAAGADEVALAAYRAGQACHPLQPFVEWEACEGSAARLGAVLVAGCRDAWAARQLGLVPAHGLGAALEMAAGRGAERIGYLLSPPHFPLLVGA
jgi:hypothetical protein